MVEKETKIKIIADTSDVDKKVGEVKENLGEVKEEAGTAGSAFSKFGGKAVTAFKGAVGGAKGFIQSMSTLKGAIMATGIGALVIAVVKVVQVITRLQSVSDKYNQAIAAGKAVLAILLDTWAKFVTFYVKNVIRIFTDTDALLSDIGDGFEALYNWIAEVGNLVKESFILRFLQMKEAILDVAVATKEFFGADASELRAQLDETQAKITETRTAIAESAQEIAKPFVEAAEAVEDFIDKLVEAGEKGSDLEAIEQKLLDTQIRQTVNQAKRNKQIAEERIIAEDITKSFAEREAALTRALELERQNLNETLANARTEASLASQRNALSESTREDMRAEAEAQAKVYEIEKQSLEFRKDFYNQLNALRAEEAAKVQENLAAQEEAYKAYSEALDEINAAVNDATSSEREKEIMAAADKYDKLLDLAELFEISTKSLEKARTAELKAINEKYNAEIDAENKKASEKRKADDKAERDAKVSMATDALSAISEITEMFSKGEGERARRSFKVAKAASIATASANTYLAVSDALAKDANPLIPGSRFVAAATAGALGIAQILKIKQTQFGGGGGGGSASVQPPSQNAPSTPQFNFDFLQQGANQNAIQAYVLPSNVNNQLQANQKIQEQASL